MINQLLIATHNLGKYHEIKSILDGLPLNILSLSDLNITDNIEENGQSYEENAILKARFFASKSGLPTIADDSGITVEAIKNELGIHTRRWGAGELASDETWLDFFMNRMSLENDRRSVFFTTLAFVENHQAEAKIFIGTCEGLITKQIESSYLPGIPLSAVFKPQGLDKVYSALSLSEKAQISHRGKATFQLYNYLQTICLRNI